MLFVLITLVCVPPLLSLLVCARRRTHVVARGGSGQWPLVGIAISASVLIFNLALLGSVGAAELNGVAHLARIHALSIGLSWMCFWIWLYVALAFPRRRRLVL